MLKHFYSKRRNIKSLVQLAQMGDEDRRLLLRSLTEDQYKDLVKVLGSFPCLSMSVTTEVVDDEEQHVVTAGSIITVTIGLERQGLDTYIGRIGGFEDDEIEAAEELDEEDKDMIDEEEDKEEEEEEKKGPVWKKPQQKKKTGKKPGKGKQKSKQKLKAVGTAAGTTTTSEVKETEDKDWPSHQGKTRPNRRRLQESGSESEAEESGSEDSGSEKGGSERGPASPAS